MICSLRIAFMHEQLITRRYTNSDKLVTVSSLYINYACKYFIFEAALGCKFESGSNLFFNAFSCTKFAHPRCCVFIYIIDCMHYSMCINITHYLKKVFTLILSPRGSYPPYFSYYLQTMATTTDTISRGSGPCKSDCTVTSRYS